MDEMWRMRKGWFTAVALAAVIAGAAVSTYGVGFIYMPATTAGLPSSSAGTIETHTGSNSVFRTCNLTSEAGDVCILHATIPDDVSAFTGWPMRIQFETDDASSTNVGCLNVCATAILDGDDPDTSTCTKYDVSDTSSGEEPKHTKGSLKGGIAVKKATGGGNCDSACLGAEMRIKVFSDSGIAACASHPIVGEIKLTNLDFQTP